MKNVKSLQNRWFGTITLRRCLLNKIGFVLFVLTLTRLKSVIVNLKQNSDIENIAPYILLVLIALYQFRAAAKWAEKVRDGICAKLEVLDEPTAARKFRNDFTTKHDSFMDLLPFWFGIISMFAILSAPYIAVIML